MAPLPRHYLVDIDPAAWPDIAAAAPEALRDGALREWAAQGWPLIARRSACEDVAGQIPLGLPLPPSQGRHRVMLRAPANALVAVREPPALRECIPIIPDAWVPAVSMILERTSNVHCFGSLAWQHLTGLAYLTDTSDLDLLWPVADKISADRIGEAIFDIQFASPVQIDGELVSPTHRAAQWREWVSDAANVLIKSTGGAELAPRERLFL